MHRRAAALTALLGLVAAAGPAAAQAQPVTIERDVEYASPAGADPLLLDAYVPDAPGPHPAIVWIHGGRWYVGDKSSDEDLITLLAAEGFAVFSINYRLAKDFPYPAAVEDAQAAVEWVRDNAATYDVDPARVGAVGVSSGGHLAALLATLGEGPLDEGSRVAAAVTFSAPMDLATALAAGIEDRLGKAVSLFLDCDVDPACGEAALEASPLQHVDATDAPMFMTNADEEVVPLEQAASMADALEETGVEHELHVIPGEEHGTGYVTTEKAIGGGSTLPRLYTGFLRRELGLTPDRETPSPSPTPLAEETGAPEPSPASQETSGWSLGSILSLAAVVAVVGGLIGTAVVRRRRDRAPY